MESILNRSQLEAVRRRLSTASERVGGVRGPPGTGKTSTLSVEVRDAAIEGGESVLVCAGMNATVDQTLLGINTLLAERGWLSSSIRRTGNVSNSSDYIRKNFHAASNEEAKRARVVCTTFYSAFVGTGDPILEPNDFDRLVFDETGQATPEQAWIPLILLDQSPDSKVSVYGDDKQLLPFTPDWVREKGVLGHLSEKNPGAVTQLNESYRLNDNCVDMTSTLFYGGTLDAPTEVRSRRLTFSHPPAGPYRDILDPDNTLVYVGTSGQEENVGPSYKNTSQAIAVRNITRELLEAGVDPKRIMVMAPYRPQVNAINTALDGTGVTCTTVHKKLGAENDVAIIAATRSNPARTWGIAAYSDFWNVATSRQRMKEIIIGDSGTTFSEGTPLLRQMFRYIERKGVVRHISL